MKFYVQKGYVSKILGFYIPGRTPCKIVSSYTERRRTRTYTCIIVFIT